MSHLSHLAETLQGSEIVKLGNEINNRIAQGEQIYNYTIGDFDSSIFPIPKELEQLIIQAYQQHYTNYPPADGIAELRSAVAAFIQQTQQIQYNDSEVLIASGGRPLIYALFRSIVDAGDKVIYAVPSWNNNHYVHLTSGKPCEIETQPEHFFMPTAEEIAPHIPGAVLLCLCTPQNPTGTTLNREELKKICELVLEENNKRSAHEKKLYVMFDQMYCTLTYGNTKHYNPVMLLPEMKAYTIFIDGISKAFAATGVRVGWALGTQEIINKMKALLSHIGAWAPMAEQKATAVYLKNTEAVQQHLTQFKKALEERLHRIYDGIMHLKKKGYAVDAVAPQAGIYLTIQLNLVGKKSGNKLLQTQADVTSYILQEAHLAVVPFYAFGANRNSSWYRLSVGTCKLEDIDVVLQQLETALVKLK